MSDQEKTSPGDNVIRKACVWHSERQAKIVAPPGDKTAARKVLDAAGDKLAEAVEKYKKGRP